MADQSSSLPDYILPYDIDEDRRLMLQHDALKYFAGGNLMKPVRDALPASSGPFKFIDIAGGSGIWAAEIASEYPDSEVITLDIADQSARSVKLPPNCRSITGDMTARLPFESETFDCLQVRINPRVRDRVSFYEEANRILKPGGFLQLIEPLSHTSEMVDPPRPFLDFDRVVAVLLGPPPSTFSQDTWTLDPTVLSEIEQGRNIKTGEKMWKSITQGCVITPLTGWPSDPKEREMGLCQAEMLQLLWRGIHPAVLKEKLMTQAEVDAVTKELAEVLGAQPPLKLSWKYNFYVAQKADGDI